MAFIYSPFFAIVTVMNKRKVSTLVITLCLIPFLFSSCSTTGRLEKMAASGAGFTEVMESAGIEAYPSTLPIYHNTGAEWNARSLELIEEADDYILISTFLGVEHESTAPVWQALAKKASEGVRVYIIIDSSSNFQMVPFSDTLIKAAYMHLRELGLETVEYNSLSLSNIFFIPRMFERDHRKYWVIDGEILAVGGVNVNHSSIAWPAGIGNIDTMAEVVSPGASKAVVETFVDTWNNYSPKPLRAEDFEIAGSLVGEEATTSLWLLDHYWPSQSKVSTMFDVFSVYAKDELWMIQGYTFLTPALLDRIKFATGRGVAVHIMLSEYATQEKYEMASRYGILDLLDAGATVYIYKSPDKAFLHAKLMVADGTLVTIGSTNYNFRSQTLARELNFLFEDVRIGSYSLDYIHTLLKDCRVVTREEAESYRNLRSWYNYVIMQVWG